MTKKHFTSDWVEHGTKGFFSNKKTVYAWELPTKPKDTNKTKKSNKSAKKNQINVCFLGTGGQPIVGGKVYEPFGVGKHGDIITKIAIDFSNQDQSTLLVRGYLLII